MTAEEARERHKAHHLGEYRKKKRRERKERRKFVTRAIRKAEKHIRGDSTTVRATAVNIDFPERVSRVEQGILFVLRSRGFEVNIIKSDIRIEEPLPMGVPERIVKSTVRIGW